MPKYADLVGQPLTTAPRMSYDCLYPALVGDRAICRTEVVITVKHGDNTEGWVSRLHILQSLTPSTDVTVLHLCPFCDQPFGPTQSLWYEGLNITTKNTLRDRIASLWKKTSHAPRVTNPQGRRVTKSLMGAQKKVCDQHRYETHILPLSVQYRWPRRPSFYRLLGHLFDKDVVSRVKQVYEDPTSGLVIADPSLILENREYTYLKDQTKLLPMWGAG